MGLITSAEDMKSYSFADAAFISQNVYLYCASEGLATGVRAMVDRDALSRDMKLRDKQKIVMVQAVGYPAN
jgi:nitroreductase